MDSLNIAGKAVRLCIDNDESRVIEFYPTDVSFAENFYALAAEFPESYYSDQTHFYTGIATEKLGGKVCDALCDALRLDKSQLIKPELAPYHYPDRFPGDKEVYVKKGHIYVTR